MTWLSPEDRQEAARLEQASRESFARASQHGRFTHVSITVTKQYPYPPESRKLALPKPMSESEAYSYLTTIAHDKSSVRGFYCVDGHYHEVKRY